MTSKDNYQDIEDFYPDLSDFDQDQQQKQKPVQESKEKNNQNADQQQGIPKIVAPAFLGGRIFKPPPPSGGRPIIDQHKVINEIPLNKVGVPIHQRERKNTIYLKNIPKTFNKIEKLTTFFRNYGSIKLIKPNQQDKSSMVRFQKEQDAVKFINSKVKVFNRSFILYDFKEDFEVANSLILECEKDEIANQKTIEHEIVKMRQAAQTTIADKYRCLLFLRNQPLSDPVKQQVERQMIKCRKIIKADSNDQEVNDMLSNIENQYDWTLIIQVRTKTQIEKKKVIQQYIKYGPIGQVQIRLTSIPNCKDPEQKYGIIKLKYLGVKSSWQMYKENFCTLQLGIQGKKLKQIYTGWQLVLSLCNNRTYQKKNPPRRQQKKWPHVKTSLQGNLRNQRNKLDLIKDFKIYTYINQNSIPFFTNYFIELVKIKTIVRRSASQNVC